MKWHLASMLRVLLVLCLSAFAFAQEPEKVSVCQLQSDASSFNHKLVQVTSFVSHGFEDFTLQEPSCDSKFDVWLEYGGTVASGTVYCCGPTDARSRPAQVEVEHISLPLVDDDTFRKFDSLLQARGSYAIVHATLVGRFFSGEARSSPNGKRWGGYGHMGCCSLLIIQQVLSVDPHDRSDLNYESGVDSPDIDKFKCGYRILVNDTDYPAMIKDQRNAEDGKEPWAFNDPQRVATVALARFMKVGEDSFAEIKPSDKSAAKLIYFWPQKGKKKYMVVVSRPYWLSFYSRENKVAWVLTAAYEICGQ